MEYKNDYFADDQLSEDEIQEDDYEKELINWYSTYPVERKRKLNKRERYEKEQKHLKKLASSAHVIRSQLCMWIRNGYERSGTLIFQNRITSVCIERRSVRT